MTSEEFLGIEEQQEQRTPKLPPTRTFELSRWGLTGMGDTLESVLIEAHSWAIETNGAAVFYRFTLMLNTVTGQMVPVSQTVRAIRQWEEVREAKEFSGASAGPAN